MIIQKKGVNYLVRENKKSWSIKMEVGNITVNFNVKKVDCPDVESLKKFIKENPAF